jgi:hypothetical protein
LPENLQQNNVVFGQQDKTVWRDNNDKFVAHSVYLCQCGFWMVSLAPFFLADFWEKLIGLSSSPTFITGHDVCAK